MFLPIKLLNLELRKQNCLKEYLKYHNHLIKAVKCRLRVEFLNNCKRSDIIPRFLKFRIPTNGCFDDSSVHEFQRKLLHKEIIRAKEDKVKLLSQLDERRSVLKQALPYKLLPSVILHTRLSQSKTCEEVKNTHNQKLHVLSEEQEKPLFSVSNTVRLFELNKVPPAYVLETLSLGPRNPVLESFDPKDVLVELDKFLKHCNKAYIPEETLTDINVKTFNYIKKCKKLKNSRNVNLTKKYLKENGLLAIPFDKGVGICLMHKDTYHKKMDSIISLPQFQKWTPNRKNAMHPLLKEEQRVNEILTNLLKNKKIDKSLFDKLQPSGSQPARLYGLAKVHKQDMPVRPVLSMPGSVYFNIAKTVANWLSHVPECKINCSTKEVCDKLKDVKLDDDEELISFDVVSLYTNVPVLESINVCADLLFNQFSLPIDKETFIELAKIASCDVLMLTHDGYYRQTEGLAMGSPPAPHLANGWMSQFDANIRGESKMYFRYMDDILKDNKKGNSNRALHEINLLHPSLKFTIEKEKDGALPMLDMNILNKQGNLSSTWYNKPSATGLIMNYHALAPKKYKRAVVIGFVHRIYRSCSNWQNIHDSLEKAKTILKENQYPPKFFDPIIHDTLTNILSQNRKEREIENEKPFMMFLQYRGKCSESYARDIKKLIEPTLIECQVIFTLKKLKTVLPSLKEPVDRLLRSRLVYKITCPHCNVCYVGKTNRHLQVRFKEHLGKGPVKEHMEGCAGNITHKDVEILGATSKGEMHLLTLEALWIRELKPTLNAQDTMKCRDLKLSFKL